MCLISLRHTTRSFNTVMFNKEELFCLAILPEIQLWTNLELLLPLLVPAVQFSASFVVC